MNFLELETFEACSVFIDNYGPYMNSYLYACDFSTDTYKISKRAIERFNIKTDVYKGIEELHKKVVYKDDYRMLMDELEELNQGKKSEHDLRYRWVSKEGEIIWINCKGKMIYDSFGKPKMLIGCINEIGDRNEADPNTGLLGTKILYEDVKGMLGKKKGYAIYFGIDDFKEIIEKVGDTSGRNTLKIVGKMLQTIALPHQKVYKLNVDEYAILDMSGRSLKEAKLQYKELQDLVKNRVKEINYRVIYTVSAGFIPITLSDNSIEDLGKKAHYALSKAKMNGKNQMYIYNESDYNEFYRKQQILTLLHNAVSHDFKGFDVYYQPVIEAKTGKLAFCEALLRFKNGNEFIPPSQIIPLLEESKLIIPVGKWVLDQSISWCKKMQKINPDFRISVNFSYIQIMKDADLESYFSVDAFEQIRFDNIIVEVTESGYLEKNARVKEVWANLKDMGVVLAIDDFGTGYSNISNISHLSPHLIKVDYEVTQNALSNEYEYILLSKVINLAHSINAKVVIEGVETEEEAKKIMVLNPDYLQGYLYSKPVPMELLLPKLLKYMN